VQDKKKCLGAIELSAWAKWILSFVQEMGVRTGPQGSSGSTKKSLSEFLDL